MAGSATISDIRCDGPASVLAIGDAVAPEHGLRIATAYDDIYNLPPARVVAVRSSGSAIAARSTIMSG